MRNPTDFATTADTQTDFWYTARKFVFFFLVAMSGGAILFHSGSVWKLILANPNDAFMLFLVWIFFLAVIMPPEPLHGE